MKAEAEGDEDAEQEETEEETGDEFKATDMGWWGTSPKAEDTDVGDDKDNCEAAPVIHPCKRWLWWLTWRDVGLETPEWLVADPRPTETAVDMFLLKSKSKSKNKVSMKEAI